MSKTVYDRFQPTCPLKIEWIDTDTRTVGVWNVGWNTITEVTLHGGQSVPCEIAAGQKKTLPLEDSDIYVDRLMTADGVVWQKESDTIPLSAPQKLTEAGAFFSAAWQPLPEYQPEIAKEYWRCGCGTVNDAAAKECVCCGKQRDWVIDHIDEQSCGTAAQKQWEDEELSHRFAVAAAELAAAKKEKRKKYMQCAIGAAAVLLVLILGTVFWFLPERHYRKGKAYEEIDHFYRAYSEFTKAGGYKDAKAKALEARKKLCAETKVSLGYRTSLLNNELGKVESTGYSLDGALFTDKWNGIRAVATGKKHSLGLHFSGTVISVGDDKKGACKVDGWTDITAIAAGEDFSVGLRKDGTVVAVGTNKNGQLNTKEWKDIIAIAAGKDFTVGLKSDGTVVATDKKFDLSDWKEIDFISAGMSHIVGVKTDGTVVAVGTEKDGECDVSDWKNVIGVAAGDRFTVAIQKDGTLLSTGNNEFGQCNVSEYKNAIAVVGGWESTAVILRNGRMDYLGESSAGEGNITLWDLNK